MDKYEYKVSADEIKQLIAEGQYGKAADIADTIDWRRVKSVMMLCTISDLYKINRRYEDARDLLLLAYEQRPGGRTICYSLCELSIKMEQYVQAIEYFKEFIQVAPKDPGRYVLQYKLYEAQDVSLEERIEVLEELKKHDYREKWAYELAYLYHRVGLATKCVEECDELILWFGSGRYVAKAMELKMLHQPLTKEQQDRYDSRFEDDEDVAEVSPEATSDVTVEMPVADTPQEENVELEETKGDNDTDTDVMPNSADNAVTMETQIYQPVSVELDFEVKPMDVGQYNTINLQAELAAGLREVLGDASVDTPIEQELRESEAVKPIQLHIPKDLEDVLSQESDGQMRLVVPESELLEKQITGQMSIEDILVEWERMKRENEEKRKEDVRLRVLEQTGTLFTDFEASMHDGLLEKLESGEIEEDTENPVELEEIAEPVELEEAEVESAEVEEIAEAEKTETTEEVEIEELEDAEEIAETEESVETEEIVETEELVEAEGIVETEEPVEAEGIVETVGLVEAEKVVEPEKQIEPESDVGAETDSDEVEELAEIEEPQEETYEPEKKTQEKKVSHKYTRDILRPFTREEKELYAPFIQSRTSKQQLLHAIDNISMAAYTGNVIITGQLGTDTLGLAKNMIREVQISDDNFSGKAAKISGASLNTKNVEETILPLKNGSLIIEKVSDLNDDTVDALYKCLQKEYFGLILIIEDTKKAMDRFLSTHQKLGEVFTGRIDIEALSDEELVSFGKQYARELEYAIDDLGILALHTRIDEMQSSDHAVTIMDVREMVDTAIANANRKTPKHFFDILFAKRYDEEDMIILSEKHFLKQ